jgi:predicted ABC-type ATPase
MKLVQQAERNLTSQETTIEQFKHGNNYSKERIEVHKKIIEYFLSEERVKAATPSEDEEPVFVMLGGRGGSGKSWFKNETYSSSRCIVLDADEIKRRLPEYEGWNAAVLHEESSDLLGVILQYCQTLRLNVVLDATMKSGGGVLRKAQEFKLAGFRVEAHFMYLPRQHAAKRAVERFCDQKNQYGRYVPIKVILQNTSNESNFDTLRPYLDAWSFWDNNVSSGNPPQYVSGEGRCALL